MLNTTSIPQNVKTRTLTLVISNHAYQLGRNAKPIAHSTWDIVHKEKKAASHSCQADKHGLRVINIAESLYFKNKKNRTKLVRFVILYNIMVF